MMKFGCIGALTERRSHLIGDLFLEGSAWKVAVENAKELRGTIIYTPSLHEPRSQSILMRQDESSREALSLDGPGSTDSSLTELERSQQSSDQILSQWRMGARPQKQPIQKPLI